MHPESSAETDQHGGLETNNARSNTEFGCLVLSVIEEMYTLTRREQDASNPAIEQLRFWDKETLRSSLHGSATGSIAVAK